MVICVINRDLGGEVQERIVTLCWHLYAFGRDVGIQPTECHAWLNIEWLDGAYCHLSVCSATAGDRDGRQAIQPFAVTSFENAVQRAFFLTALFKYFGVCVSVWFPTNMNNTKYAGNANIENY